MSTKMSGVLYCYAFNGGPFLSDDFLRLYAKKKNWYTSLGEGFLKVGPFQDQLYGGEELDRSDPKLLDTWIELSVTHPHLKIRWIPYQFQYRIQKLECGAERVILPSDFYWSVAK